jgi:pyruvate kinase
LLADGAIELTVSKIEGSIVHTECVRGGSVRSGQGVNVPAERLDLPAITDSDREGLARALDLGVDLVAQSFVRGPGDIKELRSLMGDRAVPIVAKIETKPAVEHIEKILRVTDALMVARGDLGVEMPLEKVPGIQKQITRAARRAGKPVVIATQMLESMVTAPVPTRAEVSDVATAVFEGADAVMLSAESAVGKYPVEAVATMDRVAIEVERDPLYEAIIHAQRIGPEATGADAISAAARTVAETLNLAAIVCYTASGATSLRAARERPQQPIIALTPIPTTGRKLALVWGLHCVLTDDPRDLDDMVAKACRIAYQEGFALPGQRIIISAGVPLGTPGATNMLRIAFVGDETEDF